MTLASGTRLGPYEIDAPAGAGGMGEVYRARDTRLDRTVAIKVLPADLADDQEFRQRFQTEARAISQLTHPNICTLHDIGEQDGTIFLVMELLVGETLADRLARGTSASPALSLDAALQIGIQIADALAAAHHRGIVHRDLKPGNVMLTMAGVGQTASPAKLLDFGLAKAVPSVMTSSDSLSPTGPLAAATAQGAILGTIQYMAPEQIEGGVVDARSDIFALGSVLYEMLTGQKPFEGKTHASIIAAILEREPPPVSVLRPRVPSLIDATVQKCLAKSPDQRWQSAVDVATALRWATSGPLSVVHDVSRDAGERPTRRRMGRFAAIAALAAALFGAGAALQWRYGSSVATREDTVRFEILPPEGATWSPSPVASLAQLALSPDGRRLAFVAAPRRGVSQVWIRSLETVQAQPLAGTEGASFPFWSPDGRYVAFFAGGKLKKIDTTGGTPQALADAASGRGGAWSPSGDIVFTASPNTPISRVSAAGGVVTEATIFHPDEAAIAHYWPQFLADGQRFLFYQRSKKPEHTGIYVKAPDTLKAVRLLDTDGMALQAAGHLLFIRDGILFAQAFDDRSLRTSGGPIRVADRVGSVGGTFGYASIAVSASGVLTHGTGVFVTTGLRWHDRSGAVAAVPIAAGAYRSLRLAPDHASVALGVLDAQTQGYDIWVVDLTRGSLSRVTSHPSNDWFPTWASDGRLFFGSTRPGSSNIFLADRGGVDQVKAVTELLTGTYPTDVSRDGRFLVFHTTARDGGYQLGTASTSDGSIAMLTKSRFNSVQGRFSPDGRWLAFASDESGRFEVYVRPFPAGTDQWTISVAGGTQPDWRRDGKELFYRSADGKLMAVDVASEGATFRVGVPRALFSVETPEPNAPYPTDYAVTADGQRFLVNTVVDQPTQPALTVILNWAAGLKRD